MRRLLLLPLALLLVVVAPPLAGKGEPPLRLPWREAGLTERAAAAYLLDRLAFGPRPGEIDRVVAMGLDSWVERQLAADHPEPALEADLARYEALAMPARQIAETYPSPGLLLARARAAGVVPADLRRGGAPPSGSPVPTEDPGSSGTAAAAEPEQRGERRQVMAWARSQGYRSQRELVGQLLAQKVVRAVESENQLAELLVDFWTNHFNVSMADNEARGWILAFERDAVRPRVLSSFRELLEATAKHPAMLLYLDNFRSVAAEGQPTTAQRELQRLRGGTGGPGGMRAGLRGGMRPGRGGFGGGPRAGSRPGAGPGLGDGGWPMDGPGREPGFGRNGGGAGDPWGEELDRGGIGAPGAMAGGRDRGPGAGRTRARQNPDRPQGLNENYARELLELHTLGVDGGFTQQDVVEVARALTGWSLVPPERGGASSGRQLERVRRVGSLGFREEGDFLFRADRHDAAAKTVLGTKLAAGRGLEDGEEVLDLLAAHPSTARHLARKLAARFVADEPPAALVERLAGVFAATDGDLRRVMRALVESPEFWAESARRRKIKSPLEVAASALRTLGARLEDPREVIVWIARMGQPLYAFGAPSGFPDRADHWVNSGSLLARMNFGLELATGRTGGVHLDLAALAPGREPESAAATLATYARLLLPERDLAVTLQELGPLAADPELGRKLAERAPDLDSMGSSGGDDDEMAMLFGFGTRPDRARRRDRAGGEGLTGLSVRASGPPSTEASVVALVLGSPEFQRR